MGRAHARLRLPAGAVLAPAIAAAPLWAWLAGARAPAPAAPAWFADATRQAGIRFQYDNDATPARRFVETTGGGIALLDYDNDGLLDIFAVQGGPAPGGAPRPRPPHALFRNLGGGRFQDVAASAGLAVDCGYAQGASAADCDGDGWTDLLVTAYGGPRLFRNRGGRFQDVTRQAGLLQRGEPHWPLSAAWADCDRDGDLDLFLCHYVSWFPDVDRPCYDSQERRIYCQPTAFVGDRSALYRNEGGARFADVSAASGIGALEGKAMGAVWTDYDRDGFPDLFVTSDMAPNWLLHNRGDGRFRDVAPRAGVALGDTGVPLSGMGVAAGDFTGDGHEDLFVVNFSRQPRSYFVNAGRGAFLFAAPWAGLGDPSQPLLGFGVETLDFDLDGDLDLVVGNGHLNEVVGDGHSGVTFRQRQQLLLNRGDGRFADDRAAAGAFAVPRITRGLVVGDLDNDGRPDCVATGPHSPLQVFRNEARRPARWIGFRMEGADRNREGIGALVCVTAAGRQQWRWVRSGSSYCSRSDPRLLFGLGAAERAECVEVFWPRGARQRFDSLPAGRYYLVRERGGCAPDPRLQGRAAPDGPGARED